MTEAAEEVVEEVVEEPEVHKPSPTEVEARSQGWKPQEDWVEDGGDPDEWRSAREFVDRGELFKQLHTLRRQAKQQTEVTDTLKAHHQKVYESAYKSAVQELRKERREALREEDFEKADEIEEQLDTMKEEKAAEKAVAPPTAASVPNQEFASWVTRNPWYNADPDLKEHADALGIVFSSKNPQATPSEVFTHVEGRVKRAFPEKFEGVTTAPNPVAGVSGRSKTAARRGRVELSDDEQKAMASLVKHGHMTEAEYIADIQKLRGE